MGQTITRTFMVEGMHCASCPLLIDETLEDLDGVSASTTNLRTGQARVSLDLTRISPAQVVAAIATAGYTARMEIG